MADDCYEDDKKYSGKKNHDIHKKKWGTKLTPLRVLLLVFCAALSLLVILASPLFYITEVRIMGAGKYSQDELKRVVGLESGGLKNSMFFASADAMEKNLKKLPYIKEAGVKKVYPGTLLVTVTERSVYGCVEYRNMGYYLYIDETGVVLDASSVPANGLPIIVGLEFSSFNVGKILDTDNKEAFECVVRLGQITRRYDISINKVDISNPSDIRLYMNNVEVVIGSIKDADMKVNWARNYLAALDSNVRGTLYVREVDNMDRNYFSFP